MILCATALWVLTNHVLQPSEAGKDSPAPTIPPAAVLQPTGGRVAVTGGSVATGMIASTDNCIPSALLDGIMLVQHSTMGQQDSTMGQQDQNLTWWTSQATFARRCERYDTIWTGWKSTGHNLESKYCKVRLHKSLEHKWSAKQKHVTN